MRNAMTVELLPGLELSEPLGVASSHLTQNARALEWLRPLRPGFLTLKTCSLRADGHGGQRVMVRYDDWDLPRSVASIGPKSLELLSLPEAVRLAQVARGMFPDTKLGVSVLVGEPYDRTLGAFGAIQIDYFELNLKYLVRDAMRDDPQRWLDLSFDRALKGIGDALSATARPLLVKLSRDTPWLLSPYHLRVLASTAPGRAGFILANTRQQLMLPHPLDIEVSYAPGLARGLHFGTLSGRALLPETLNLIYTARAWGLGPLVASGGVMDAPDVEALMRLGATGVQLCTALSCQGRDHYLRIRRELEDNMSRSVTARRCLLCA